MMKQAGRRALERLLGSRGWELKRAGAAPQGFAASLALARSLGVAPRTVFDIGVGHGTPWLYDAFPDATLVLVEPLPCFVEGIARIQQNRDARYHAVAVGAEAGSGRIFIPDVASTSSTLKPWTDMIKDVFAARHRSTKGEYASVEIRTLDSINDYEPPYFIKIDAEGSEVDVLRGAARTLERTLGMVVEISILDRHVGGSSLRGVLEALEPAGFELVDIPEIAQIRLGGRIAYLDGLFLRRDVLRAMPG